MTINFNENPPPSLTDGSYFNSAGAGLMSRSVVSAMVDHLHLESMMGSYEAAAAKSQDLSDLYLAAGQLLGCDPDEIALTGGNTSGWQTAIGAINFSHGDRILVGRSEWGGNYAALLHIAHRVGAVVEVIPCNEFGEVCLEQLRAMLDSRVKLISLTWMPANGGLINPAAEVGALARANDITYVLDAAQAVGQIPVNVRQLGCDVLTAPGRKWLRGPRGTGLMYVRRRFFQHHVPVMIDQYSAPLVGLKYQLREDARRFETSEACVAARVGFGVAIRSALTSDIGSIQRNVFERAERVRNGLLSISHVRLHDLGRVQSGLISFSVIGISPGVVKARLMEAGVNVAVNGIAFTPLDMQARGLIEIVRASPHIHTSDADVDRLIRAVELIAS
ncbi:MAG: aminotransferase class V-fold PLP-dependent enzyme [Polaromonas sp.]|nr:aminotransferase class V-fold PLP-dependent enzyme [Polaromonas sp.]